MGKVFIFILLGGFVGPDGYAVSPGILVLAHRLRTLGEVSTHNWSARDDVTQQIAALSPNDKVVLIGYSGGGFAITEVAQDLDRNPPHKVDLLIAYDPSPTWSVKSIGNNVARAICYCNDLPLFFGMGGAKLRGSNVETVVHHRTTPGSAIRRKTAQKDDCRSRKARREEQREARRK